MSYQVIARKWRPQNFDQLVGQAHISTTLQNALKNGRLPHALLFTGPRGTGKTSSARILAKSLCCPNSVNFVPCNLCQVCEDITIGRNIDVMEIDGASNNGVDAIRDLRETVGYMPSSGKYKIYIIDEVHMLSTSAFNALLKTLEEPPEHVVFILATTEVHKIPQTIMSRCQRFDFRRISTRQITDRLALICQKDGFQFEDEALWAIARQADGSMRDAQSLLDQVITFANGPLTRAGVVEILGLTDHALLLETLTSLVNRDQSLMLVVLEKISRAGYEPSLYAQDLMENLRHLLLIKIAGENVTQMIELADSEIRALSGLAQNLTEEEVHFLFDMAVKGAGDLSRSSEPRVVLEMVLLRMASAPQIRDLKSLLSGAMLETPATSKIVASAARITPSSSPAAKSQGPKAINPALQLTPTEKWFELVQKAKQTDAILAAKIEPLLFNGIKDNVLDLSIPHNMAFLKTQLLDSEIQKKLKTLAEQGWGSGHTVNVHLASEAASAPSAQSLAADKQLKKQADLAEQISQHPKVKSATAVFGGQIKSIKERGPQDGGNPK